MKKPFDFGWLLGDPENCKFDQPCKFGYRVEDHSVYCTNETWKDAPRKCHRTWFSGGEYKDEDCPGFEPNPDYQTHTKVK